MDRLAINFGVFFGIIGLLISLIFSLFSKNPIFVILTNIFVSTIVSVIIGIVVFFILKQKVPEILDVFEGDSSSFRSYKEQEEENFEGEYDYSSDTLETSESLNLASSDDTTDEIQPIKIDTSGEKTKHFGDHIVVDKITIKNEPKLMAEAIRTMLSKDE
ncbi:MAG: hypothetical protein N2247_10655 [Leptospiraceae bacterium]|nr:hypothetical protein [Leptospiraceae bacterium]